MFTIPSFMGFDTAGFVDPDAQAFFNRVTAAGGTLSNTEKNAVNTLVVTMKANGIWTPMKAIYPMVGASAAACAQNLKSASFTGTFTSGWTFASTGATPNGTSAYMDTNFNQQTFFSQTNGELGFYSRTNVTGTFADIGSYFAGSNYCLFCYLGGTQMYGRVATLDIASGYNPINSLGLFSVNESGTNTQRWYKNGVLGTTTTTTTSALESINLSIGAAKTGTTAQFFSPRQCAFAYISDSLTGANETSLYTAVQAFQTTLSRQV